MAQRASAHPGKGSGGTVHVILRARIPTLLICVYVGQPIGIGVLQHRTPHPEGPSRRLEFRSCLVGILGGGSRATARWSIGTHTHSSALHYGEKPRCSFWAAPPLTTLGASWYYPCCCRLLFSVIATGRKKSQTNHKQTTRPSLPGMSSRERRAARKSVGPAR